MRLVAGRHRGRPLAAPAGGNARPTADRTRETLFNILLHGQGVDLDGMRVLDAFAGSGALGLEALSRGAAQACFMDSDPAALAAIRANAASLGEQARVTLLRVDATRPPTAVAACDLALLDPPYHTDVAAPALTALAERGWLAAGALCVVEVALRQHFAAPPGFTARGERASGAARLVFLDLG